MKIPIFRVIISFMPHTSTEKTQFLNQCFFMAFIESKNYKSDLDSFIDSDDSGYSFRLKDFIEHQKITKETMGLVPIDALVENECSPKTIDEIETEYNHSHCQGGYTRLFLERLFDQSFKKEFNIIANYNYFTTRAGNGLFDFDLVGKYFESIKSYFKGDIKGWNWKKEDFEFTEKKLVRSKKSEKASKKNPNYLTVEKLDNVYSAFKIYGQGNYSRILIALLKQKEPNKYIKLPENLQEEAISYILDDEVPVPIKIKKSENKFKDETIKQNVSHATSNSKKGIVYQRISDLQIDKTNELLQRFFEDYKPSTLNRVYTFEKNKRKEDNKIINEMISGDVTLRGLLICEFKNIARKQWNIYKALEAKNLEDSYETVSMKMNYYTNAECKKIQDKYESLFLNKNDISDCCSTEEMLEYILKNEPTVIQDKAWKRIINKYAGDEYFKEESSDEMNDAEIQKIINTCFSGYSERLFNLFKRYFVNIPDFIEVVAKHIQDFSGAESVYISETQKIVLANAIRNITKNIEKKEIYKCINSEEFSYSSLETSPFNFNEKRIEKAKMLFLLENWRYHPDHPWQSFWMKYPRKYKSSINYESFKLVMDGIYQQFNEVVL